jgi:hypothetical protein
MAHLPSGTGTIKVQFGGRIEGISTGSRPLRATSQPGAAAPTSPTSAPTRGAGGSPPPPPPPVPRPRPRGLSRSIAALNETLVKQAGDAAKTTGVIVYPGGTAASTSAAGTPRAAAVLALAIGANGGVSAAPEGYWFKEARFLNLAGIAGVSDVAFATEMVAARERISERSRSDLMKGTTPAELRFIHEAAGVALIGVTANRGAGPRTA